MSKWKTIGWEKPPRRLHSPKAIPCLQGTVMVLWYVIGTLGTLVVVAASALLGMVKSLGKDLEGY
jgi:hypothetical protein